ncbi:MAG: hypothetical protein P3T54_01745 [Dehalogenimonas sp.]|uniref:Uncharacterized protein n=1 Tax=Candidatus Dehalogenimonas loeffleri TaxID=3127115 RepID=A0ABZ2J949_9CHLR|nr:hypothetical protein [Dehalogenimonas sp.]
MVKSLLLKREKALIHEWITRFMDFSDIIAYASGSDVAPSEQDQNKYSGFRHWFIQNEAAFLPLWWKYLEGKNLESGGTTGNDFDSDGEESAAFINNPFGNYYHPKTLVQTFVHLGLQKPNVSWESCDDRAGDMRTVLIGVLGIAVEFYQWALGMTRPVD